MVNFYLFEENESEKRNIEMLEIKERNIIIQNYGQFLHK